MLTQSDLPWQKFKEASILITGANGMLPSYIVFSLVHYGELHPDFQIKVFALVRDIEKAKQKFKKYETSSCFQLIQGDVCDSSIKDLGSFDYIIHGASPADPRRFGENPLATFLPNVQGTYYLLEMARKSNAKGFIFLSSGEVYGQLPEHVETITEETFGSLNPLELRSCYGEGKRAGETLCALYAHQYNIPATIVRIGHTFGPTMDVENDSRVFAEFVRCVLHGENLVMKSDGSTVRPFCYVRDAVDGILRVLLCGIPGQAYLMVGDEYFSILELAELLCSLYPERNLQVVRQTRSKEDRYLESAYQQKKLVSAKKLKALGWRVNVGIKEGFERTICALESKKDVGV